MIVDGRARARSPQNPAYKPAHGFHQARPRMKTSQNRSRNGAWNAVHSWMTPARFRRPSNLSEVRTRDPGDRNRGSFHLGGNVRQFQNEARRILWRCRTVSGSEAILFVEIV